MTKWLLSIVLLSVSVYSETILLQHDFSDSPRTALHEHAPKVGENKWVAGDAFRSDGSVLEDSRAVAALVFRPKMGVIYQLDARFECISKDNKWLAAGFFSGGSTLNNDSRNLFSPGGGEDLVGKAWAILKGNPAETKPNGNTAHMKGTSYPAAFSGELEYATGPMDIRMVLNTKGRRWTATWYAKEAAAGTYVLVRPETELPDNKIDSIGFASNRGAGHIRHISLKTISDAAQAAESGDTGVLIKEEFDSSTVLHGRQPLVGNMKWVADASFKGNGSVHADTRSFATLPFDPAPGHIYELDVRLDCVSLGTQWIGAGFFAGKSAGQAPVGQAWAILKGDPEKTTPHGNTTHMNGTGNPVPFNGVLQYETGTVDLRIVLDTQGRKWTATWYAKKAEAPDYTVVRPTTELKDQQIAAVGLISNKGAGKFDHILLRETQGFTTQASPPSNSSPKVNPQPKLPTQPQRPAQPKEKPAPVEPTETLGLIIA